MHALRHELGHAIEHTLTETQIEKIEQLRLATVKETGITIFNFEKPDKIDMMNAGTKLSYYGLKDTGEYIAESVAEYLNGRPREKAMEVLNVIFGG